MPSFRAYTLAASEATFKKTLNAAGRQFTAEPGEFPGVVRLKSKNTANFYYAKSRKKVGILQHLTHGVLAGDLWTLTQQNNHVSTSFVIGRDGTVYQLFDSSHWAYHIGANTSAPNSIWSPKTIAIEVSCLGPLSISPDDPEVLIDAYKKPYCLLTDTQYYGKTDYRGYKYYATLTDAQYDAINTLVGQLCEKHKIVFSKLPTDKAYDYYPILPAVSYFMHTNVRKDKTDCSPVFEMDRITGGVANPPIVSTTLPSIPSVPTTPPAPAAPAAPAPTKTWIVITGDTLYGIAARFGVGLGALQAANPGINPLKLQLGQKISIP